MTKLALELRSPGSSAAKFRNNKTNILTNSLICAVLHCRVPDIRSVDSQHSHGCPRLSPTPFTTPHSGALSSSPSPWSDGASSSIQTAMTGDTVSRMKCDRVSPLEITKGACVLIVLSPPDAPRAHSTPASSPQRGHQGCTPPKAPDRTSDTMRA